MGFFDLINICNFTCENDRNKQWEGKWLWKKSYLKYSILLVPYVYFMFAVPAFINNNMYYMIEINCHIQKLIKKEKIKPSNTWIIKNHHGGIHDTGAGMAWCHTIRLILPLIYHLPVHVLCVCVRIHQTVDLTLLYINLIF